MQHFIELHNKYRISFIDHRYCVDQFTLNDDGVWQSINHFSCTNIMQLVDWLLACELSSRDIADLNNIKQILKEIQEEFAEIRWREEF